MSTGQTESISHSGGRVSRIRLGSAPDSWGVWFADDPAQISWERFLDELVEAGYSWLELGPHGYLPTDPPRLRDELEKRGLHVSGGGVEGALHRDDRFEHDLEQARGVASLLHAVGGRYLIYLPAMYRDLSGAFIDTRELDGEGWNRLVTRASEIGRIVRDEFEVSLVFHPHADSHVATQSDVERFVNETDASSVSLCLDTGHISYCGGDNMALIGEFPDRIGYVHLKQVDPKIMETVRREGLSFSDAVRMGATCEPPNGSPDMALLIEGFKGLDVDLFAIVEQDMYPCEASVPLPIATRTCEFYGRLGLGAGDIDARGAK